MGFSPLFINFLQTLYKQNISMIINNGFLSPQVSLQRGLRQGCPLSFLLYAIQSQITTTNITQDKTITGINIPNQKEQVKILQYANGSNFFRKNQESVKKVLTFFQNLNKATGATINLEKTTVLPINTDNTKQIQQIIPPITVREQYETTKILGIYFNEDLKNANHINWDNIMEKMEKHINILAPGTLSLYRKTILINTLILSKASYLSNVFPISADKINKINNRIFKYL